jgi:phage-related protein
LKILILDKAQNDFDKLPFLVQEKFNTLFRGLINETILDSTKFKKLKGLNLYEFRVKHDTNIYRGIGGIIKPNLLVTIFFKKKTQGIPDNQLKTALSRYKKYISQI